MYTGSTDPNYGSDGAWKGLTVSSSGSANELSAQLTGQGNLVVARGDSDPLRIGNVDGEENSYTGRTWVMSDASVQFADDNAFGQTSQLRIDRGASVNLGDFDQTVGALLAYGDNALVGSANSVLTVTNSATIDGSNDQFLGRFVFDSEQSQTGTVSDVDGLGLGSVAIGGNYTLEVVDQTKKNSGDDSIVLDNDLLDANGQGAVLQIGQVGNQPSDSVPIELAGDNKGFSGTIRVQDGWKLTASVGDGETITDRLGSGVLNLLNGQASIDFVGDVQWDHQVTGSGELVISAKDHSINLGDSAFGDDFSGTVTVGGGSMDLASNADKLGNGDLAASGSDSSILVSGDQSVSFGNDLTIKDGASLVFEDTVDLSEQTDPELIVDGSLVLDGAIVNVSLDGELDISYEPPKEGLDMSAITMADESELSYVLAKAGLVDKSGSGLILNGSTEYNPMSVDITNGTETIAKGKYDFGLGVSEDRTELGLSYKLVEVEINPADLRVDVFRASGAGGQHIQKTESAVRITHIPTGIVTVCQNDRSQHRNKEQAMSQLKAKLYEAEMRKRREVQQQTEDAKSDIAWGHQIRSYVLDQSRVKDLRTNVETGNTQAVLDGDLDQFIEASLKQGV